jgi:hypothetical protein
MNVLAFSGGKDSTALALRLSELGEDFSLFFTPTGNELPELLGHIRRVKDIVGKPLIVPPTRSLQGLIRDQKALPNPWMRWCTRIIKIEPCIEFLKAHPGSTLIVGLRADEPAREGLFGDFADYRYPFREWGWGINEVYAYLESRGVCVPPRTDCALCYDQRLEEWYRLLKEHPEQYAEGETLEDLTGHTFRSPSRDTYPASLKELRREFESGRVPRGVRLTLFGEEYSKDGRCRVCRL